jgi:hypothetical protein
MTPELLSAIGNGIVVIGALMVLISSLARLLA